MTRWDDLPLTGLELWVYRHRVGLRVMGVLGVLAAVALAAARLASGEGTRAALTSLGGGVGFAGGLVSVHAVQLAVEKRGEVQGNRE